MDVLCIFNLRALLSSKSLSFLPPVAYYGIAAFMLRRPGGFAFMFILTVSYCTIFCRLDGISMLNALDRCDKRCFMSMTSVWADVMGLLAGATGEREGTRLYRSALWAVLMPIFTGFNAGLWLSFELLPRAD